MISRGSAECWIDDSDSSRVSGDAPAEEAQVGRKAATIKAIAGRVYLILREMSIICLVDDVVGGIVSCQGLTPPGFPRLPLTPLLPSI